MAHSAYNALSYRRTLARAKKTLGDCGICGRMVESAAEITIDHIREVSSFPPGTPAKVISDPLNLRIAHKKCNLSRGRAKGARNRAGQPRIERNPAY